MEDNISATYTSEQMLARADAHYFQEFKMTASMLRYAVAEIDRLRGVLGSVLLLGNWPGASLEDAVDLARVALVEGNSK